MKKQSSIKHEDLFQHRNRLCEHFKKQLTLYVHEQDVRVLLRALELYNAPNDEDTDRQVGLIRLIEPPIENYPNIRTYLRNVDKQP